jgi:3-hydroxyethyl bacteriochlorophyllide a dehydrogenase
VDVSGDSAILDRLIGRLAPGGEIVLAGFYEKPLSFDFAPAFLRETRMRVSAEFKTEDMTAVVDCINDGRLCLDDLITHQRDASDAGEAYRTAFGDASCLKMILDWRGCA